MQNPSVVRDAKEDAGLSFARVIEETRDNFPDPRFRPVLERQAAISAKYGINAAGYAVFANSDGTGTKPELAERLADATGDMRFFENPAFDATAMVADDTARDGKFLLGVINSLDINSAEDPAFIAALARGMKQACNAGRFPLLNGETAELGYRSPGYGKNRLNWNMTALTLTNPDKVIDGRDLRPGQTVVGLREKSIRSNGLTRARAILEHAYLAKERGGNSKRMDIARIIREKLQIGLSDAYLASRLDELFPGTDIVEQVQLPWHTAFPEETKKLLTPSTIYTPLIYEAQGGVDGERNIPLVACAHISGGGIPLKGKRMIGDRPVGLALEAVFPDPEGVPELMAMAQTYPKADGTPLVHNRSACEQWNRGVGFLCVLENMQHADDFVRLSASMGYEAAVMGQTVAEREIRWRGERWAL